MKIFILVFFLPYKLYFKKKDTVGSNSELSKSYQEEEEQEEEVIIFTIIDINSY